MFEYVSDDGLRYAQFWDHDEGGASTARYDYFEPAENVINVERVEFENGPPARFLRYARLGVSAEVYRYVAGKLSFIHGASNEHGVKGEPTFTVDHIHYLPDGSPMLIVRHWEGGISERIYPTSGR